MYKYNVIILHISEFCNSLKNYRLGWICFGLDSERLYTNFRRYTRSQKSCGKFTIDEYVKTILNNAFFSTFRSNKYSFWRKVDEGKSFVINLLIG